MEVDHGLTVPLNLLFGQPKDEWPCPVIPLAVNVVHVPAADRTSLLHARQGDPQGGRTPIRRTCKVVIFGTGGLSHQISGPRAGLINSKWDKNFLDNLSKDPKKLTRIPHIDYMREAGAEGIEMVMWLIMRGALDDKVEEVYRFYTVPASNTAVGHIILENRAASRRQATGKPAGKSSRCRQDQARRRAQHQSSRIARGK